MGEASFPTHTHKRAKDAPLWSLAAHPWGGLENQRRAAWLPRLWVWHFIKRSSQLGALQPKCKRRNTTQYRREPHLTRQPVVRTIPWTFCSSQNAHAYVYLQALNMLLFLLRTNRTLTHSHTTRHEYCSQYSMTYIPLLPTGMNFSSGA